MGLRDLKLWLSALIISCAGLSFAQPVVSPNELGFSETGLSFVQARHLKKAEKEISETKIGRKLLAETEFIPDFIGSVKKNRLVNFAWEPNSRILFDKNALLSPPSPEFDLALIRALSIASLGLPVETEDSFFYARVNRVLFMVEYGARHPKFAKDFNLKVLEAKKLFSEGIGRREVAGEWDKTAFDEILFIQDAYSLYQVSDAVPFVSQIEDFAQRYGPDFGGVVLRAQGKLAIVHGKVYPGILLDDAEKIVHWGGLRRLKQIHFYDGQDIESFSKKMR